ncbi:hypothetical protein GCM10025859_42070 [Alicyclobacillus fastidiosus]|nr:hypothetical protein GCM10025859_42070 [Alicyclobacillus fastidiosus]
MLDNTNNALDLERVVLVQKYLYTPYLDGILNQIRSMFTIYGVPKIFCTRTGQTDPVLHD